MFAAAACSCNNNSKKAECAGECTECTECCDTTKSCDTTKCCGQCDSTSVVDTVVVAE